MNCRHCKQQLVHEFLNLGYAPPSNSYLSIEDLNKPELTYPLRLFVCSNCWLVQIEDYTSAEELFDNDYAYFSSVSKDWLAHAKSYVEKIIPKIGLTNDSYVIEIAANDGYLLKNFVELKIPCLGIEPTANTAEAAEKQGIAILRDFFSKTLATQLQKESKQADLIIGNNVYAHVPDLNNFTAGLKILLKERGTITLEFPHLMQLLKNTQFDTVYHEHFSYLSLYTVIRIFSVAELRVWHVEELDTHGGSLRIYGCHENDSRQSTPIVAEILAEEELQGMRNLKLYSFFQERADRIKNALLKFLIEQKDKGKKVVAYGAAAKGNTILNYAGVKSDLLPRVYDAAQSKQEKFLPGSHIPILNPDEIEKDSPDYILILPWNISKEIMGKLKQVKEWNCQFVTAIPEIEII